MAGRVRRTSLQRAREQAALRGERTRKAEEAHARDRLLLDRSTGDRSRLEVELAVARRSQWHAAQAAEIAELLLGPATVETVMPAVAAVIGRSIGVGSVVLVVERAGAARSTVWVRRGTAPTRLQRARDATRSLYGRLARSSIDLDRSALRVIDTGLDDATEDPPAEHRSILLPLVLRDCGIFGAFHLGTTGPFDESDLSWLCGIVRCIALAVDRDVTVDGKEAAAAAAARTHEVFSALASALAAPVEATDLLEVVARSLVPSFADLCVVDELRDDGTSRRVLVGRDEATTVAAGGLTAFAPRAGWRTPEAQTLALGRSHGFPTVADPIALGLAHDAAHAAAIHDAGLRALLVVPMRARGRTVGALSLGMTTSGRRCGPEELGIAQTCAERIAVALDNAQAYRRARLATQTREDLLAVVSHDLRTPLGLILMTLRSLLRNPEGLGRNELRLPLERMRRSADRMGHLIADLLDTASIDAGRLSVEPAPTWVGPIVAEVMDAMQPLAGIKSVRLSSSTPTDLPPLLADGPRLQQVLVNLLGNAIKFSAAGGRVALAVSAATDVATFAISDTGVGIHPEDLPRLFERFWQSPSTARFGTGLGLFIAKGIVEAHGGRIRVESVVGSGTTVVFTVPVAPPGVGEGVPPVAAVLAAGLRTAVAGQDPLGEEPSLPGDDADLRRRELHTAIASMRVARDLAERANAFRGMLTSVLSVDLRRPLTEIELLIERARRSGAGGQDETLEGIGAAVRRAGAILESLLQHALVRTGLLTTGIETFDPAGLAAEVVEELRDHAREKGLALHLAVEGLGMLRSDPVLVRLILLNLVSDAIRSTDAGTVRLEIDRSASDHRLVVRDTRYKGRRRPLAAAERVPLEGSLVRDVTLALGGRIDGASHPGRGATVTVTLASIPPIG